MNPDLDRTNLQNALATPLVFLPGQNQEERLIAARQMVERSFALQSFLNGLISWDDYLCLLQEHGIDAINAHNGWSDRICFL